MLVLFTDYGLRGPYTGLLKLALVGRVPSIPVIDLFHDVPPFDSQGAAYLLAAYVPEFPDNCIFVGVIDPGVGSARDGLIVRADNRYLVGPDNGLFDRVMARTEQVQAWRITWRPQQLSATFHGRDIFAPVAAMLASKIMTADDLGNPVKLEPRNWPDDLARIIYIDQFGNAMTGIRAQSISKDACIVIQGQTLHKAHTFSAVPIGQGFWYENSSGLVELAVNQRSAAKQLNVQVGDSLVIEGQVYSEIRDH